MNWIKLPVLQEKHSKGCLNCGELTTKLSLNYDLDVGFGDITVTKDGEIIWAAMQDVEEQVKLQVFEDLARVAPDHDYRVFINSALYDATYQRQDTETWVLVEKGQGFA